jgi:hypothetical protein
VEEEESSEEAEAEEAESSSASERANGGELDHLDLIHLRHWRRGIGRWRRRIGRGFRDLGVLGVFLAPASAVLGQLLLGRLGVVGPLVVGVVPGTARAVAWEIRVVTARAPGAGWTAGALGLGGCRFHWGHATVLSGDEGG